MPKKILIIEDEDVLRDMYVDKFSQAGFKVLSAGDAEIGIKLIKKEKPDLILLDILLPRENGLSLLKQLKKEVPDLKSKIVAFSNFDDPEAKKQAAELGVVDYLIKTSYTPKQIVEKVARYLE